jgi:hypothetical protein
MAEPAREIERDQNLLTGLALKPSRVAERPQLAVQFQRGFEPKHWRMHWLIIRASARIHSLIGEPEATIGIKTSRWICYNIKFSSELPLISQAKLRGLAMKTLVALAITLAATLTAARAADGKIEVVAAENFYGNVAQQIGGDRVSVTSVLSNPDQDPHLFEVLPAIIRQVVQRRSSSRTAPTTIHGSRNS